MQDTVDTATKREMPENVSSNSVTMDDMICGMDAITSEEESNQGQKLVQDDNSEQPSTSEETRSEMCQSIDKALFKEPKTPNTSIEVKYVSDEIIDVPSDSDDDRDYYYCDTTDSLNDISIINTVRPANDSTPSCSFSSTDEKLLSSSKNQVVASGDKPVALVNDQLQDGAEVMVENNNDILYTMSKKGMFSSMPKLGYSRDSDNASPKLELSYGSSIWDELLKDAKLIHALLPRFNQRLIYKTLCNNQHARNRIELTLWDLLPEERPQPQILQKRKYSSSDVCLIEHKKNTSRKDQVDANLVVLEEKKQVGTTNEVPMDVDNKKSECRIFSDEIDEMKKNGTLAALFNDNNVVNQVSTKKVKLNQESVGYVECSNSSSNSNSNSNNTSTYIVHTNSKKSVPFEVFSARAKESQPSTSSMETKRKHELFVPNNRSPRPLMSGVLQPARLTLATNFALSSIPQGKVEKRQLYRQSPILSPPKFRMVTRDISETELGKDTIIIPPSPAPRVTVSAVPAISTISTVPIISVPRVTVANLPETHNMTNVRNMPNVSEESPSRVKQSGPIVLDRLERPSRPNAPDLRISANSARLPDTPRSSNDDKEASNVRLDKPQPQLSSQADWRDFALVISQKISDLSKDLETKPPEFCKKIGKEEYDRPSSSAKAIESTPSPSDHPRPSCSKTDYNLEQGSSSSMSAPQVFDKGDAKQLPLLATVGTIANNIQPNNTKNSDKCRNLKFPNTEEPKLIVKDNSKEIILSEKANKIYVKLLPMFPSIKTNYIKRLCHQYVKDDEQIQNEGALLEYLVEILLNCDQKNLINETKPAAEEPNPAYDMNEKYADLLMIFPEADPVYLRKVVEEIYNDPERFKEFVQSKLENPNYPTREQYLAKKKITDQQKQYTTDFQVNNFLEIFPDPFAHFEDHKRKCLFNPHAVDFLKFYFSKLRVNTLMKAYVQYNHNLSLTAKALEALNPDMKTKRYNIKMVLTEDIPFLQECAFIRHKTDLKKYLNEIKVKEEQEFNELKAKNELLECQCCYDNECMPSKCSTCEDGHLFCNSCIIRSTDVILGDGKTRIDCLLQCGCEIPISVLQRVLPPTKFSILLCKQQEAEVMAAGVEGLVSCPFCHFASIPPPEDKIFKCLNPECMKESCRFCKELNHVPLKCNEKKSESARLYLEEKMTEALVRKCYRCNRIFFKEEGCNKMTCLCGAEMCYICDKPVTDYTHFQGQGAERSNLCPLWSDNRRLNAESVIKVCHETVKQMKEKDPQVDINVDALLPKLPPKSKGPHEDIVNNAMIHNRIARQFQ
ncbi:uncharacterized protein LOC105828962 [Monomorium pharaonis]|uniref:uncharacterized protein LOC105828962 n=1 Tax=Monomorium pharaonis TaxID=307658 RepID=UPI00063F8E01|nr:uncharacterized protein LOC105828962 [Monomorium pharaonis]XP_036142062.1 uncharacterized protein LOC105828962 [Monomorium pharaonis]